MDAEIDERGLPRSLKWLPVIESSYLPSAESRVGAAGLWQLMGPTAMELGLEVGSHVDQRLDPVVSTGAGLDYLATLYRQFDSWLLALAAYNSGPGRVSRLLSQHAAGTPRSDYSFELIAPFLPLETREFVPKFLAYATVARSPGPFGLVLERPDAPLEFDVVTVPDATSLDVIARAAGHSTEAVEELNPQILRGYTPFGVSTEVRVPAGAAEMFADSYSRVEPGDRISFIEHQIQSGETLSHLADRYGVPVSEIRDANPRVRPSRLQIGQWITVPRVMEGDPGEATRMSEGLREPANHRVRSGDTLGQIAVNYGVSVRALAAANGMDRDATIRPGQMLVIPAGAEAPRAPAGE